jgi:hypothetical protein
MLLEFLIIGSFWWWLLSFATLCFLVFLIEEEKGAVATFALLLGVGIVQLFSDFDLVGWMWENPLSMGVGFISYFVVGAFWGTIKFRFFVCDKREQYDEAKEAWLEPDNLRNHAQQLQVRVDRDVSDDRQAQLQRWADALENAAVMGGRELTDALKPAWTDYLAHTKQKFQQDETNMMPVEIPHPKDHKARIMRWMGHWPWSMLWTLINDPFRRICKMLYKRMTVILVDIAQEAFAGVEDDFVIEENEAL